MDNPLPHDKGGGVPMWAWALIAIVVVIALTSHSSASSTPSPAQTVDTGSAAATSQLQAMQLQVQGAIASKLLDVVGTEDIARIQARSQEVYGAQSLAAITAQSNAAVASSWASTPQPPVTVIVNKPAPAPIATPTARAFNTRAVALSAASDRTTRELTLNNVAGALGDGLRYAHSIL